VEKGYTATWRLITENWRRGEAYYFKKKKNERKKERKLS